jgi:hypothetical protein
MFYFLLIGCALHNSPDMPKGARESFIDVILHEDMSQVKEVLKSISKGNFSHERPKGFVNVLWNKLSDVLADLDPRTFGKALKEADADSISNATSFGIGGVSAFDIVVH